jgi:DNA-binding sugar fermentation-stimulating protein
MEDLREKMLLEGRIQVLADYASRDALREVMIIMIKQEARDIKMVRPNEDEKMMYEEATRHAQQRMVDAIQTACNGKCTGS